MMKKIDILTYLLVADPNKETKKILGKLNMQSEVTGIEMSGDHTIDIWCKPRSEEKENGFMSLVNVLSETYKVYTVDTHKGEIVASRDVQVEVNKRPGYKLY